jgi:hypothetical protein
MLTLARHLTIGILVCTLVPTGVLAQRSKQSNRAFLEAKWHRFQDYAKDLAELSLGHKQDDTEWEAAIDLSTIAQAGLDYITAAMNLLDIHSITSCQMDRDKIWQLIKLDLANYAKMLDMRAQSANTDLSQVRTAAIAVSGTQLKDDLRALKSFFESIQPN